jgi:plastocyanin
LLKLALAGAAAAALAFAPLAAPAQPAPITVRISNMTFAPQAIAVSAGATVTWINDDDLPHTVTADDKAFKSKVLDTGEKFSFTFAKAGEYAYFCSIHPKMIGKVIVKAS